MGFFSLKFPPTPTPPPPLPQNRIAPRFMITEVVPAFFLLCIMYNRGIYKIAGDKDNDQASLINTEIHQKRGNNRECYE